MKDERWDSSEVPFGDEQLGSQEGERTPLCITIDGKNTFLREQAVSVEKIGNRWHVAVHVALAAAHLGSDEILDELVRKIVSGDGSDVNEDNLLVKEIRKKFCLKENVSNEVLSVHVDLDSSGSILSYEVLTSSIVIDEAVNFEQVTQILEHPDLTPHLSQVLTDAQELAQVLHRRRNIGSFLPNSTEEELFATLPEVKIGSSGISAELMLLANNVLALFCESHKIPAIYRNCFISEEFLHDRRVIDAFEESKNLLEFNKKLFKRGLDHSKVLVKTYDVRPLGHFSLGLGLYLQATSPLLDPINLLNQINIFAALSRAKPFDERALMKACQYAETKIQAEEEERWRKGLALARYKAQHKDVSTLDQKNFSRVIWAAIEDPSLLTEAVQKEFLKRLWNNELSPKDLGRVLFSANLTQEWGALGASILHFLKVNPSKSMLVYDSVKNTLLNSQEVIIDGRGSDSNSLQYATVQILQGSESRMIGTLYAKSAKSAKYLAMAFALAYLAGFSGEFSAEFFSNDDQSYS